MNDTPDNNPNLLTLDYLLDENWLNQKNWDLYNSWIGMVDMSLKITLLIAKDEGIDLKNLTPEEHLSLEMKVLGEYLKSQVKASNENINSLMDLHHDTYLKLGVVFQTKMRELSLEWNPHNKSVADLRNEYYVCPRKV